jgi:parallel beta-helix repeat protein
MLGSAAAVVLALSMTVSSVNARPGMRSYYVDPAGNDSNPGTSAASPWRSIAKLNSVALSPGDHIYFKRGGLWRETLAPHNGGASGNPVTFSAYGTGPQPVISGSDVVGGWRHTSGSVYQAHSLRPGNVYVDGGPGWGLLHACCAAGEACVKSKFCAIGPMTPGSWYWDSASGELYVWLVDGSPPATHMIEAATREYGLKVIADGSEKSDLVFDGLTFERTAGGGIYFYSNDERGVGLTGVVVRNSTIRQVGTGQVDDGSYYNGIHYSQARELPTAPTYEHNRISYTGNHGNAINSQNADGARILNNDVTEFNHHGFDMKSSRGVLVRGNVAHDSAGNGIYQESCADSLLENNIVYNISGVIGGAPAVAGRGSGIQIDEHTTGVRIYHNSIYNVFTGIYTTTPVVAEYNAVAKAGSAVLEAAAGGVFDHNVWGLSPVFYLDNRRYDIQGWQAAGHPDDIAADPMWVDPAHGNFSLFPWSPLIAARIGALSLLMRHSSLVR